MVLNYMKGGDSILKKKQILMALIVAVFVVGAVGVPAAQAKTKDKDTNTTVNTTNNDRPGWGFGDKNHHHLGPPGHSVNPGDGDNDRDDRFSQENVHKFIIAFQQAFHNLFAKFFG